MDIVLNIHYGSCTQVNVHEKRRNNAKHEDFVRRKAMLERDCKLRQCKRRKWFGRIGVAHQLAVALERGAVSLENKSANEREQFANEREQSANEREQFANEREQSANEREQSANEREQSANEREQSANEREQSANEREQSAKHLAKRDVIYVKKKKKDVTSTPNLKVWQKDSDLCVPPIGKHRYVGLDCEMVGSGPNGMRSELARCSIVSYDGDVLYDCYVKPVHRIVDYRTCYSGITKHHMKIAVPFSQARIKIEKMLQGKVVVGHALHHDFDVIHLCHPSHLIRDTSVNLLLKKLAKFPIQSTASLKYLTKALLKQDIQMGTQGHSSVEDARAAMQLFQLVEEEWEKSLAEVCVDDGCSSNMKQHTNDSYSKKCFQLRKSRARPQTKRVSDDKCAHVAESTTTIKEDCVQSTSKNSIVAHPKAKKRKEA